MQIIIFFVPNEFLIKMNATPTQQNQLTKNNLKKVNKHNMRNNDTIKRIIQMAPQFINDPLKGAFFNGTEFYNNSNLVILAIILSYIFYSLIYLVFLLI